MNRNIFPALVVACALVFFSSCKKETANNENVNKENVTKSEVETVQKQEIFTPEFLYSNTWEESVYGCTPGAICNVRFMKDMKYSGYIQGLGSEQDISGTYKIENNKLTLSTSVEKLKGGVLVNDDSLYYTQYIEFENKRTLFNKKCLNIGRKKLIKGINTITMGMKEAKTTTDLKFRETPDEKGKQLTYRATFDGVTKEYASIPSGVTVYLLARTENMVKVQKWENYWYYIDVNECDEIGCETKSGWVFGEFVK